MDPDRFQVLYDSYGPAIFARCCRLLHDHSAAEDAAQEVFLRVYRHLESAPVDGEALPWMFRITTNYCLNMIRDRRLRPTPIDDLNHLAGRDGSSEDRLAERDLGRRLTLGAPAHLRAVAWLHHVEGLAQHEVAQQLGISRRTVVNYLAAFREFAKRFPGRPASAGTRALGGVRGQA